MTKKMLSCILTSLIVVASNHNNVAIEPPVEVVTEEVTVSPPVITTPAVGKALIELPEIISLGEFTLTAYCSCSKCCGKWAVNRPVDEYGNEVVIGAAGEKLTPEYSIAVDPNVIPYGTVVTINGHTYKAQDTGGSIKGNKIDVYFSNHNDALEFGVQTAEVYIKKEVN